MLDHFDGILTIMDRYEGRSVKAYYNPDEYYAMLQTTTVETEIMIDRAVDGAFPGSSPSGSRVNDALETGEEVTPVMTALDLLDDMYGLRSDLSRKHLMTSRKSLDGFSIADLLQGGMLKEALEKIEDDVASDSRLREH